MKFVSKNLNLRIVLRPGTEGNRLDGQAGQPGLYVKFEDGEANVDDHKLVELMVKHPGFNRDFIKVDEGELDPYAGTRRSTEHEHDMIELEYGHVKRNANPRKPTVTPEMRKIAIDLAKEMAAEIAPKLAKEMVKEALQEAQASNNPETEGKAEKAAPAKRKPGRPKKSETKPSEEEEEDKPEKSQD